MKRTLNTLAILLLPAMALADDASDAPMINDTGIFSLFVVIVIILLLVIQGYAAAIRALLGNKEAWHKIWKKGAPVVLAFLLLNPLSASAQDAATDAPLIVLTDELYWLMWCVLGFLGGVVMAMHMLFKRLYRELHGEEASAANDTIMHALTDAVPIDEEGEIMLDHNYDGIRELDNSLPPWWKYGFYISIVFAVIYLYRFHVSESAPLSAEEYTIAMAEAQEEVDAFLASQANRVDENSVVALTDASRLAKGQEVFKANCVACHGEAGQGLNGLGPNFTDEYWLHGGGIKNVFSTIKYGVPQKGMISWQDQLSPSQMQDVASYILTLQGTNPPNAREPQGEIWVEPAEGDSATAPAVDSTTVMPDTTNIDSSMAIASE